MKQVDIKLFDVPVKALVDTGSSVSVVSESFVKRNQLGTITKPANHNASIANGQTMQFTKYLEGVFEIQNQWLQGRFFVSSKVPVDCIIGMNILQQFRSLVLSDSGPNLLLSVLSPTLSQFSSIFDKSIKDSCLKKEPHVIIPLEDGTKPSQARVRKLAKWEEDVLSNTIPQLLEEGVIRKSHSPWRHSPVIVPKRTGGWRVAINYRPVNSRTVADSFPLSRIDEMLEALNGSTMFSSLDFSQFYYQLPLHTSDIPKTAFFANGELYEFLRCPFGLKNAVSYCCRVMKELFAGVEGVLIYMDDLLIFGSTAEEHNARLQKVLTIIQQNNLSLNLKKCSFYRTSVDYLGHRVENGTIKPDPERTKVILHAKVPRTIPELERFLGMANYFRSYVPNFANLSNSMYDMKKSGLLSWNKQSLSNFQSIKNAIASSILTIPLPDEKLTLVTDASADCIAGVLLNGNSQPVSFCSRKLSDTEKRWATIEKECFAIVWSIGKLRSFLLCRSFIVKSDHKPLEFLFKSENIPNKIHRWRTSLIDYNFTVEYLQGKTNFVADWLSRIYSIASVDEGLNMVINNNEIRKAQKHEMFTLFNAVKNNINIKPKDVGNELWSMRDRMRIRDGILCLFDKPYIPDSLRQKFLKSAHFGHLGNQATLERLRECCFWPGMRTSVNSFVVQCRVCSLTRPRFVSPTLTPYLLDAPLQMVAADYIGPMPPGSPFSHLLVIIDAYSRFPEVIPVLDLTAATLINCFRDYFARYGFPDSVLTDRGTQFMSTEFVSYLQRFGVKKLSTTAYHPSSNGVCERFNQTLQRRLLSLLTEHGAKRHEWLPFLPTALLACRTTKHSTTGFRPCDLMFSFRTKDFTPRQQQLSTQHPQAAGNIVANRVVRCQRVKTGTVTFHPGDEVMIRAPHHLKLQLKGSTGVVVKQIDQHVVAVRLPSGEERRLSSSRLSKISPLEQPAVSEVQPNRSEERVFYRTRIGREV